MAADPFARFLKYIWVNPDTGCWDWIGGNSRGGKKKDRPTNSQMVYATFWDGSKGVRAHVWIAFQFGIIPEPRLPEGMQLDHLCENSLCVSPWHLELVQKEVNNERRFNRQECGHLRSGWDAGEYQLD